MNWESTALSVENVVFIAQGVSLQPVLLIFKANKKSTRQIYKITLLSIYKQGIRYLWRCKTRQFSLIAVRLRRCTARITLFLDYALTTLILFRNCLFTSASKVWNSLSKPVFPESCFFFQETTLTPSIVVMGFISCLWIFTLGYTYFHLFTLFRYYHWW